MELVTAILRFLDPLAIGLVFGGSFAAAALRSTRSDLAAAFAALRPMLRADPARDARAARVAVARIEKLAEMRSIACADRVETAGKFLRLAAIRLADAPTAYDFSLWADEEAESMIARHVRATSVWRAVADAAPAMGMLGTILALSTMFAGMDDVERIGPAMAMAMLTTFHGVLLSFGIAGPIAARLERLSAEEAEWRHWTCRRLAKLADEELSAPVPRVRLRHAV